MDKTRARSLWPLSFVELLAELIALGAIVSIVLGMPRTHTLPGELTLELVAILTYVFLSVIARVAPYRTAATQYATAPPARRHAIVVGYRALFGAAKAEVLAFFAAMLAMGAMDSHQAMTLLEGAVIVAFVIILFSTIGVFMLTVVRARDS